MPLHLLITIIIIIASASKNKITIAMKPMIGLTGIMTIFVVGG
jgi:hypothetical protein